MHRRPYSSVAKQKTSYVISFTCEVDKSNNRYTVQLQWKVTTLFLPQVREGAVIFLTN